MPLQYNCEAFRQRTQRGYVRSRNPYDKLARNYEKGHCMPFLRASVCRACRLSAWTVPHERRPANQRHPSGQRAGLDRDANLQHAAGTRCVGNRMSRYARQPTPDAEPSLPCGRRRCSVRSRPASQSAVGPCSIHELKHDGFQARSRARAWGPGEIGLFGQSGLISETAALRVTAATSPTETARMLEAGPRITQSE